MQVRHSEQRQTFRNMVEEGDSFVTAQVTQHIQHQSLQSQMKQLGEPIEDWVRRASESLILGLDGDSDVANGFTPAPSPDTPAVAFGIQEAERCQTTRLPVDFNLELLKTLRWGYLDLVDQQGTDSETVFFCRDYAHRFFDQAELAFFRKWLQIVEQEQHHIEAKIQQSHKFESLGVLAGGIAHEFNNVLMTVLGNADLMLLDLPPKSPIRSNLNDIEEAARRAAELCRQLLAYAGKGRYVIEPINLSNLIEGMERMLSVCIPKGSALRFNLSPSLPEIPVDASQIRQVILNLVTNAAETFTEKSGVITITTGMMDCDADYFKGAVCDETPDDGQYVFVEVSDTGPGMDAATQERLFEPFFTTKFAGRGLGMPAVLGIVRSHGGALRIYSELGHGTTCKVLFPVASLTAPETLPLMPEETGVMGRILVVDDEPGVRRVGQLMLRKLGYQVIEASSGIEALEIMERQANVLTGVLLDLTMPEMDGLATFQAIRRIRKDLPVLLTSGYNESDATERFAGRGLAGFLQKPYTLQALHDSLQAIILSP